MKRRFALAIATCLGLALASCGTNSVKAPPVTKPAEPEPESTPDRSKMTIEEYAAYSLNEECKSKGIALGKDCDRYAEEQDAQSRAARKAELDKEAERALDRINNPSANCSAVLNKCW